MLWDWRWRLVRWIFTFVPSRSLLIPVYFLTAFHALSASQFLELICSFPRLEDLHMSNGAADADDDVTGFLPSTSPPLTGTVRFSLLEGRDLLFASYWGYQMVYAFGNISTCGTVMMTFGGGMFRYPSAHRHSPPEPW